jgi:predicted small lipoprotein YifL
MFKRRHSLALRFVTMTAAGSLLASASLLSGCGQKGPLTLGHPIAKPSPAALPASSPSAVQQ